MKRYLWYPAVLTCLLGQSSEVRTHFRVKYVAENGIYLDGGRSDGLAEKMKLTVTRPEGTGGPKHIAEVKVTAVAETSAACSVLNAQSDILPGDVAELAPTEVEVVRANKSSQGGRQYAQSVGFTEGDPIEEEARASVPRPPSPAVNRTRGRIGFEYNTIREPGSGMASSQLGLVFRGDMTRIGGSYWNLSGYWRGRLTTRGGVASTQTMTDLLNRTYHLTLYYDNPLSAWAVGFGRFYLPWATSLDTIDGGYAARRFARRFAAGIFAGSTPDPTSWNYNPDRELLGSFLNYSSGSFESLHLSSTAGLAVSRVHWKPERQFAFFENSLFYKRFLAIYHNLEADQMRGPLGPGDGRVVVTRSFLTVRIQPVKRLSFDVSHNHFRNQPTFDPRLAGTGLLDRLLFQGVSGGVRLELPQRFTVYTSLGRSQRTGDERRSLNQMYGVSKDDLFHTGLRADVRYSKFDSPFGHGAYRSLSLSREFRDVFRVEILGGDQDYSSAFSQQGRSRYVNAMADWTFALHYFLGGGYTIYRSRLQSYDQIYLNLGYRF